MKKFLCSILALSILTISSTSVFAETLYNTTYGLEIEINDPREVEIYLSKGWKRLKDFPAQEQIKLYSVDGRTLEIPYFLKETYERLGWYKEPPVKMYALDGRTLFVIQSEVEAHKKVGWYEEPMVTLYTADGRSQAFPQSEVAAQKTVGWFDNEPMITLYAIDGRSKAFPKSQVAAQKTVGWYDEPFVTMYALDGRTAKFPKSQVAAQKTVGWYENKPTNSKNNVNQNTETKKTNESVNKFSVGSRVMGGSTFAYTWRGTVKQISNGKVLVNWDSFYNKYGKITSQSEISSLEYLLGIHLNEPTWYNPNEIRLSY